MIEEGKRNMTDWKYKGRRQSEKRNRNKIYCKLLRKKLKGKKKEKKKEGKEERKEKENDTIKLSSPSKKDKVNDILVKEITTPNSLEGKLSWGYKPILDLVDKVDNMELVTSNRR